MTKHRCSMMLLPLALVAIAPRSAKADALEPLAQRSVSGGREWQTPIAALPRLEGLVLESSLFIDPVAAATTARGTFSNVCLGQLHLRPWQRAAEGTASCVLPTPRLLSPTEVVKSSTAGDYGYQATGFAMGFAGGYGVPALLHYSEATVSAATKSGTGKPRPDLALSVSPGGPCTGACLKLAGSF